jgi:hypothetical protein
MSGVELSTVMSDAMSIEGTRPELDEKAIS